MEIGNGGDTPALISNVEVLELLQKNLAEHQPKHHHKRWKQRDWLQSQVVEYLKSTPCVKLDPSRRQEFQSLLQGRKRRAHVALEVTPPPATVPVVPPPFPPSMPIPDAMTSSSTAPLVPMPTSDVTKDEAGSLQLPHPDAGPQPPLPTPLELSGFGLAEAEAIQILNFMPTEAVEIHLMVDDLNARLTPKQQDALLEAISNYSTKESLESQDESANDSKMPASDNPDDENETEM